MLGLFLQQVLNENLARIPTVSQLPRYAADDRYANAAAQQENGDENPGEIGFKVSG
jgi:hypothetical protein